MNSGDFVVGNKYLVIFQAQFKGNNNAGDFGIRALHGSTVFTGSTISAESTFAPSIFPYTWFTVWTAISSEGLKLQQITLNSAHTITSDQLSITAIEISEELTENVDWFFDTRTTQDSLTTTFTTTNPSVTFTPNGSDDYLVMTN